MPQHGDTWPNDHDWLCMCDECEAAWEDCIDDGLSGRDDVPDGIDDEAERELDTILGLDGW